MSPPRIMLFGCTGQVGSQLARRLPALGPLRCVPQDELDFTSPSALRQAIRDERPDLLINAAAYTAVDRAEQEPDLARLVNTESPRVMAEEAAALGTTFVHYSTDYVFDGSRRSPYTESDPPCPLGVYGRTKRDGDYAVMGSGCQCLVFRISWVYGATGQNFLLTMQRLAAAGKPLRVVDDQVGSPTTSAAVADGTLAVLNQVCGPAATHRLTEVAGLYNMVCGGQTSWHGFARAFLPASVALTPITTAEYPTPARRPSYSVLDTARLYRTFGVSLPTWQEALAAMLQEQQLAIDNPPRAG